MPVESKAQQRLMEAAAHTKGGFGGVSQKVGKEFVAAGVPKDLPERVKPKSRMEKLYGREDDKK